MKKNMILTVMSFCMFMTAFLTVKVNANAGEMEGFIGGEDGRMEEGIYGIDGKVDPTDSMYSDYYIVDLEDTSKKPVNLMTLFKDFIGYDKAMEETEEYLDGFVLGTLIKNTGLYGYVTDHFDILNYVEEAIDEDKTAEEVLKGYGVNIIETLSPIHSFAKNVVELGENLWDKGKTISDSTISMIEESNEREREADKYFSNYPDKLDEIEQKCIDIILENENQAESSEMVTPSYQMFTMMYDGSASVTQIKCRWESDSEWMELLDGSTIEAGNGISTSLPAKEETLHIKFIFDNGNEVDNSLSWETIQNLNDYYGGECLFNFSTNGIWDV